MCANVQMANRVEEIRKSLNEASDKVRSWPASKRESAQATVDPKRLASYYESIVPKYKK